MIEVRSRVRCYEVNGREVGHDSEQKIDVCSHWNIDRFVVLEVGGMRVTVSAKDLVAAVANATNMGTR